MQFRPPNSRIRTEKGEKHFATCMYRDAPLQEQQSTSVGAANGGQWSWLPSKLRSDYQLLRRREEIQRANIKEFHRIEMNRRTWLNIDIMVWELGHAALDPRKDVGPGLGNSRPSQTRVVVTSPTRLCNMRSGNATCKNECAMDRVFQSVVKCARQQFECKESESNRR